MKLKTFRVLNYKSVEDSGDIDVAGVTCLVGKNEAGKSSILEALAKLNPVDSGLSPKFELEDYPRRRLNEYKRIHPTTPAEVIRATFELSANDRKNLAADFGPDVVRSGTVTVTKKYENARSIAFEFAEDAIVRHLVSSAGLPPEIEARLKASTSVGLLAQSAKEIPDPPESVKQFQAKLEGLKSKDNRQEVEKRLEALLPRFFYFDDYSDLPGSILLNELKQYEQKADGDKKKAGERAIAERSLATAVALLRFVEARAEEFQEKGNYERLMASLEAASNRITDQVFTYWTQNRELDVQFNLEPVVQGNNMTDMRLHVRIRNQRHRVTVPFDKRSRGFVWFFSFLVAFSDYRDRGENIVLLLDEPGLNLHARAQLDFLRFIDQALAPHHQVLYTTHSPFMIEPTRLERVRTVEDVDKKGTCVSNDPLAHGPDTLFPLQAALGYELAQALFVGPNNLVVEGTADLVYLSMASERLVAAGRTGLAGGWTVVPAGGADKIPTFVALLGGNSLNIVVFMDVSGNSQQRITKLVEGLLLEQKHVVTVGSVIGTKNADIEDMLPPDAYLRVVSEAYKAALNGKSLTPADLGPGDPRIVKRVEKYFEQNGINGGEMSHYAPAHTLAKSPGLQSAIFDVPTLDRFEAAFKRINPLLRVGK